MLISILSLRAQSRWPFWEIVLPLKFPGIAMSSVFIPGYKEQLHELG